MYVYVGIIILSFYVHLKCMVLLHVHVYNNGHMYIHISHTIKFASTAHDIIVPTVSSFHGNVPGKVYNSELLIFIRDMLCHCG